MNELKLFSINLKKRKHTDEVFIEEFQIISNENITHSRDHIASPWIFGKNQKMHKIAANLSQQQFSKLSLNNLLTLSLWKIRLYTYPRSTCPYMFPCVCDDSVEESSSVRLKIWSWSSFDDPPFSFSNIFCSNADTKTNTIF